MSKFQLPSLWMIIGCFASLAACGGKEDASTNASTPAISPQMRTMPTGGVGGGNRSKFTLADGPDVCFRAAAKQLGANAKISELTSFFSPGNQIDPSASAPQGEMTNCTVQYQDPQDPRKLLEISMDTQGGTFSTPRPVEITVMGGDASKSSLEQHLITLSQVNAAGLEAVMDAQKGSMGQIYSKFAWSGVRLEPPGLSDAKHTLRLDIKGRLAFHDLKADGYESISTDGKTIIRDLL